MMKETERSSSTTTGSRLRRVRMAARTLSPGNTRTSGSMAAGSVHNRRQPYQSSPDEFDGGPGHRRHEPTRSGRNDRLRTLLAYVALLVLGRRTGQSAA